MENPHKETYSISDVAKRLGKNPQYIRELIKREKVPWGICMDLNGRYNYLIVKERFERWLKGEE